MIQLEFIETLARLNAHDFRHFCITLDDLGADLVGADAVPMMHLHLVSQARHLASILLSA